MSGTLRERALRLLARREHARVELSRKLAPYAESTEQLDMMLDDLTARRLLSDERYVEMRLNARSARFGNARLAHELRTQGVAEELVSEALAGSDDELSRARQVWQRKFGNTPAVAEANERARQMRFLMSRGFSGETIRRVLRGDFEDD
jgi:regulatory protein